MSAVHPSRITAALNAAGCYGKRVDVYLGGVEPMVDEWEAGKGAPTSLQLFWLADLTGVPPWWLLADGPATVVGRACPGFHPIYERPPGADPEGAKERLRRVRSTVGRRAPV